MTRSIGEKEKLKKIVEETLDVFSETSLEYKSNRKIVAKTIVKDLVSARIRHEQKQKKANFSRNGK